MAEAAHKAGALVCVDNSFLTPVLLRPLEHGIDIVVHTATKYMCGHGDALGGVITTNDEELDGLFKRRRWIYGQTMSPFNAFLILRGLTTLPLRVRAHSANAMRVAQFLSSHPAVTEVRYPGLPDDPGHAAAAACLDGGFGGMLAFAVKGGRAAADRFTAAVNLCKPWVSLGDAETLIYICTEEPRRGIPDGYVRMSVGLENADDITADLDQALARS